MQLSHSFQIAPVFRVGVEVIKIFLLYAKVLVRSLAREIGSASLPPPERGGYLSTSSSSTNRIGFDESDAAELAPVSGIYIFSNCSASSLLSSSRNFSANSLVALSMG